MNECINCGDDFEQGTHCPECDACGYFDECGNVYCEVS